MHFLPDEGARGDGVRTVARVPDRTGKLFEGFVRGVARHFLHDAESVDACHLAWHFTDGTPKARALIPQMRTDATVVWRDGARSLVECKFYESPLAASRDGGGMKFISEHLYQTLAYLRAMARDGSCPSGTLIYASPGGELDEKMVLEGFPFRVVWLDLTQEWQELRDQTIDAVQWRGERFDTHRSVVEALA